MTKTIEHGSAKIYQFPVRERIAANARNAIRPAVVAPPPRMIGGAWYHDAAIEETKPGHDR